MDAAVAVPWHRHLDDVWSESRKAVPPRCRESTRGSPFPVTPHGRPNARRVGKPTVVDEVHTAGTLAPMARPHPSIDSVSAQAEPSGLRECYHAIVSTQIFVKHA
jgi:hypothetical protein